mmetsp:Transcript_8743/g.25800  ORF Transcript_8743/g.25800 Transcript_8743/m.25800 type:complete len:550 (+) Transcript_8743:98-1747(+)
MRIACALSLISGTCAGAFMPRGEIEVNRVRAVAMYTHAFGGYMQHAFPHDELKPLTAAGTDNLVELGGVPDPKRDGYSGVAMTLIDCLDTIAVMGNHTTFAAAVKWVGRYVSFDQDAIVSVFETTIRVLGGLLSAHVIAAGQLPGMSHMQVPEYDGALLGLARDLGDRLLPAFEEGADGSGIPYPFVHLQHGVGPQPVPDQCLAGAGTNLLEFALLSNLTADVRYARASIATLASLWVRQSEVGLFGNTLHVRKGTWGSPLAGIGAGADSFYEYLGKGAELLHAPQLQRMWRLAYGAVRDHLKAGPYFVSADMHRPGRRQLAVFGALQAFWPGMQVLAGDVDDAKETHAAYMAVWDRFDVMPENFQLKSDGTAIAGATPYPLRPEVAESTLALFEATGDHTYLHFGARMLASIDRVARTPHGYASVRDVRTGQLEDSMPSYFLAETVKYLYLLFDPGHPARGNREVVISTEAHFFPVLGADALPSDVWADLDCALEGTDTEGDGAATPAVCGDAGAAVAPAEHCMDDVRDAPPHQGDHASRNHRGSPWR